MWLAEGGDRARWRVASTMMSLLVNINRDPKKGNPAKPSDFTPYSDDDGQPEPGPESDIKDLKQAIRRMKQ